MIAKDNHPLSIVEDEGFRLVLNTAAPLYKIPGRKVITDLIEKKYDLLSTNIRLKLADMDAVTLTTDIRTDTLNTKSYLGMTVHFVCENQLKSVMLGVTLLKEQHTSENLGAWLLKICNQWGITQNQIVAIVTDNAANIVSAVKNTFGKEKHLACFAHTLNLVACSIIEQEPTVHAICNKVKELVKYFNHSVKAYDELRKYTKKRLIQSVPTRWNSTYLMLNCFIEMSEIVLKVLWNLPNAPPMLSGIEMQLAKETLKVLKPLYTATTEACAEYYVTASKVIPLINCVKNKIESLQLLTSEGKRLKHLLLASFEDRFDKVESIGLLAVSTILDPRFKRLHFQELRKASDAVQKIVDNMKVISKEKSTPKHTHCQHNDEKKTTDDDLWSYHESLYKKAARYDENCHSENETSLDLKHYLNEPITKLQKDPFIYWKKKSTVYPILAKIAYRYLTLVATSVPAERLFSKANDILTEKRNRLSPEHFQQLLFLSSLEMKDWLINE